MEKVILNSNSTEGLPELTQSLFNAGAAIYCVESNYELKSQIVLPVGSKLIIQGGSIKLGKEGNRSQPNGIFLLCSNQNSLVNRSYSTLCLTAKAKYIKVNDPTSGSYSIIYSESLTVFMGDGDYINNVAPDNFEMRLTCDCRLMLPKSTNPAILNIHSNKVNTIQIDGKCKFQIMADNCKLERIFACTEGMVLVNDSDTESGASRFENCEIFATSFAPLLTPPSSFFLSIWATTSNSQNHSVDVTNSLNLHDCVVRNLGLVGTVNAENCRFVYGSNLTTKQVAIKCSAHSRIINSLFDGQDNIIGNQDFFNSVIDCSGGQDVLIDGCAFIDYKGKGGTGCRMINITLGYNVPLSSGGSGDADKIDPLNGAIIRNCHFDLPKFTGSAIEVWNDPKNANIQDRSQNRQFTLIDGNYLNMPVASAFVNCLRFSDYVIVRNNFGCVNKRLVLVNQFVPDHTGSGLTDNDRARNKVHDLIIEGNILRYQEYTQEDVPDGMLILQGTYIENLVLADNYVEGSLWSMWPTDIEGNLTGVVRVVNNQSVGNVLLRSRTDENKVMPHNVITFFSGNVSNGEKTDIGPISIRDSMWDSLLFNGRIFFDSVNKRQYIYLIEKDEKGVDTYTGKWYYSKFDVKL